MSVRVNLLDEKSVQVSIGEAHMHPPKLLDLCIEEPIVSEPLLST